MIVFRNKTFSETVPWSRSEHMKMLHQSGRYQGTSKIGVWNQSKEKHKRMASIWDRNRLDKSSHGYGSEYAMRVNNRNLLYNKFQGEEGYIYFLEFPKTVKVGFSKDWERRVTKQILGGTVLMIVSGPTKDLADLEFDCFMEFQPWTQLDSKGQRYTEYIDKSQKNNIFKFLRDRIQKNKNLKIIV